MKIIDLLVKIANNEEVPKKIKIEDDELYFSKYKNTYIFEKSGNLNWCYYVTNKSLNDEIEIIEEETTYEQNFTGWKLIQNGKVVASYNAQRLKPVDIADVEKDVKEMLEEKPKKIEEVNIRIMNDFDATNGNFQIAQINFKRIADKVNEIQKVVNYLLEKESDKYE